MRYMGGLRKVMPLTYLTMLIGSLSLVGIFPFAGFWSKDEILLHAWGGHGMVSGVVFWLLMVSVFLTAVYTFRMIYMTFHGEFRGGIDKEMEDRANMGMPRGSTGYTWQSRPGSW
jgi:NADH-quinone oxidoreductase subunit L